jgi:hypothetical protein
MGDDIKVALTGPRVRYRFNRPVGDTWGPKNQQEGKEPDRKEVSNPQLVPQRAISPQSAMLLATQSAVRRSSTPESRTGAPMRGHPSELDSYRTATLL